MHALPYWRLSGYYFFYFAFIGAFSPYFGLYLQSLNFSAWDIGLLMSQMQLMRLFGPNLWGWLADRFGRRMAIIRLAAIAGLAGFTAFFWLDRLGGMLVAMAVIAFFWSAALPLVETLTFDHLREQRGHYSRIRLWGSVGFIVAVLATGAVLDVLPLNGVLWVCWGILCGILVLAAVLPDVPSMPHPSDSLPVADILRQPRVRALLGACFAMSAAHGALYVFYSIHLAANGYSKAEVGGLWSLGVLAEIAVFMLMARLVQCYSLRALLLASFAAAVLRFLLIGWGVESMAVMVVAQLMHGLTFGAYHAAEIQYVWPKQQTIYYGAPFTAAQTDLSNKMVAYWAQFAKRGDPNVTGNPNWPAYTRANDTYLTLAPGAIAPTTSFAAEHQCAMWTPGS